LILHAPACWKWMILPLSIYVMEVCFRYVSQLSGQLGQSVIMQGLVLPSRTTGLVIRKPANFRFVPGDWVFVKIPKIARFEWHAFTISSAPEESDFFTLHIRGVGGWTNKLYAFFEEEYRRMQSGGREEAAEAESAFQRLRKSVRGLRQRHADSLRGNVEMSKMIERKAEEDDEELTEEGPLRFSPYRNLRRKPTVVRYSIKRGDCCMLCTYIHSSSTLASDSKDGKRKGT